MNSQDAIDLGRESLMVTMQIGGPILLIALIVGLAIGILQGLTQIHDQTVAAIPKIVIVLAAIGLCLPWLTSKMIEYTQDHLRTPVTLRYDSNAGD
jgi:flagellar biosynthetic protein FliQ